jgi:hypothetical protein
MRMELISLEQAKDEDLRWTPDLRQVTMRESCFYKRLRNRSSHEAISAEAQRDV